MEVFRKGEVKLERSSAPLFTAAVDRAMLLDAANSNDFVASMVHFPRGVRNKFHSHTSDQILIVTHGIGTVATGETAIQVSEGDVVCIPAEVVHWHGANDTSEFAHISIVASSAQTTQLEE